MDDLDYPIPHGFIDPDDFVRFCSILKEDLPEETRPLFQGSSVTGFSYHEGRRFDEMYRSDFDIALAGPILFAMAKSPGLKVKDGTRIGPLSPKNLEDLGLADLRRKLIEHCGRQENFMLFDTIEAALK